MAKLFSVSLQPSAFGLCVLAVLLSFSLKAAPAFVYENNYELQSGGDFNGDGRGDLIILDKATGSYRIGYQLSPGSYTWVSARASGVANATGLGIGRLDSLAFDSLAVAGPDANRVNILDASNTISAGLPASVFIPSLGPNLVGVIDIGGVGNTANDDLYVASLYNGLLPYRETLLRNDGTTNRTVLADNAIFYQRERANAVLIHTNRYARLALFDRSVSAGADVFEILDFSGGAAVSAASVATARAPQPYEYVTGQFDTNNPYTQFLVYPPTGWYFYEYQITEPSPGTYTLAYTNTVLFTNYVDRIFALPGAGGTKLLVLYSNDVSAAVFNFDGKNPPSLVQSFNADPGQHFTGAGVLDNNGFMAYSAPLGQNTSATFKQFNWTGAGYSNAAAGSLPQISPYSSSGNVMQFRYEPFVTNNPVLLRLNNAGDWTESPSFSGSPGNISVTTETFLNPMMGLANPTNVSLGSAHPLAQFGLANQYSNMISLFSFTPPTGDKISDVTISPVPGTYATSIQLQFAAANSGDNIYFRLGSGAWNAWSNGLVVWVFTNTTVQYYGQPTNSATAKSLVKSAAYTFTAGPSTLDSNGDGVPDYVKIARGLDPNGPADSDGDGYSDLEELIHGTDPLDPNSAPTNFPHLDSQAVFNVRVTPRPWDGFSNAPTLCATGAVLHAYDLQGSLLSEAALDAGSYPTIDLSNVIIVLDDRLVAEATDLHYHILTTNSDTKVGREMIGLVPVPSPPFPTVTYTFGSAGGNLTNEANAWIAAASNAFYNLPRATLTNDLTVNSTIESLLFERAVAQQLGARSNAWWTNITLFPFRPGDAGRTNPPQDLLLALETASTNQPGYQLQTLFETISNLVEGSGNPNVASLRAVVQDIYRTDSLLNNSNPGKFVSPVDEIRYFLWNGAEDSNYLAQATTVSQFAAASNGAAQILASLAPRPTTNVLLVVRADTMSGDCRLLDLYGGGATFALEDSSGLPFAFPGNFQMLPGTFVQVAGYTDVSNTACGDPGIEVTAAMLNSVPIASDADSDGNLLIDSWENRFFGHTGVDPFADADGDGY
ncbi:MAG: hypothetical protein KGJ60_14090, partial [Verrucomicrobiota bacterium]|nr:hypothetical protein [Verrucomicrobiota bacterium]